MNSRFLISGGRSGSFTTRSLWGGEPLKAWNDLWRPELRNRILLVDGAREVIEVGLNSLGYSLNDTDDTHLQEAKMTSARRDAPA